MKLAVAVVALAVAAALPACGGTSGPSKADYIARADKICRAARSSALPLVAQLTAAGTSLGADTARKLSSVAGRLHASEARYLAQLRSLRQPSGDQDAIDRFLTPADQVVSAIASASKALSRGDVTSTLSLLAQAQGAAAQAQNAADSYGFKDCGAALALVS